MAGVAAVDGSAMTGRQPVGTFEDVSLVYGKVVALDDMTLAIPSGCTVGLIGPDGVGKSSLLALLAGVRKMQTGTVDVLGGNIGDRRHREAICARIAYMPQGLGKNLYPDLSVYENIAFFSRLFGQSNEEREERIAALLIATGLEDFRDRPAGKLSGGMRQKLGLCCALIHDPDLLILDEPTTGVDPLSRRQFWTLISGMRAGRPEMSVVVATAYMDEAEQFDWLIAMDAGRPLAEGTAADFKKRTGSATLEESFIALLPEERRRGHAAFTIPPRAAGDTEPVIVARGLTRQFGDFTAVDHVDFTIERGEIFGFVGSNGCGKTTTMKMLTGLLPASEGTALLFGHEINATDMAARYQVGYMSQAFSLYSELTVSQNLVLHARLFHLSHAQSRIDELISQFGLTNYLNQRASDLPLGIRQRLSLAVSIVHRPKLLILDEPTSGVDPLARDEFWQRLSDLSRKDGVTIFVSTHFMNEAARCDRIALMNAGKVLAMGVPADLVKARGFTTLEDTFIDYLEKAQQERSTSTSLTGVVTHTRPAAPTEASWFSLRRLYAYAMREALELVRDPIRMGFALLGTVFLMAIFGTGISTDVDNLSFAVLDRDNSHESRTYLEELRGSRYFIEKPPIVNEADLERRMQTGDTSAAIEIPPDFGRLLKKGAPTEVGAWVDGAMPFRAETIRGYLIAVHAQFLSDYAVRNGLAPDVTTDDFYDARRSNNFTMFVPNNPFAAAPARIEARFRYNQNFDSIYAQVPGTLALLLVEIPAILMALSIVREKELGSIINLYVTPVSRVEFLLGKQLPYVAVAMINFGLMCLMAIYLFNVPLKGSFLTLAFAAFLYVIATTGIGMLISAFCSTQIAALFGAAILTVLPATQFCGMLVPVSSLEGFAAVMGRGFPMTYFLRVSVGTFTKSLGFADLYQNIFAVAVFIPILTIASVLLLPKQES
ncbi:ribosome-associated ATPase/putative transporter RbbA [Methylovirgula ligni]